MKEDEGGHTTRPPSSSNGPHSLPLKLPVPADHVSRRLSHGGGQLVGYAGSHAHGGEAPGLADDDARLRVHLVREREAGGRERGREREAGGRERGRQGGKRKRG